MNDQLLIGGKLVDARDGRRFETINPATEEIVGAAADATADDLDDAIAAARAAFDDGEWATDAAFRANAIRQLRDAMRDSVEALRTLTVAEVGAPVMLTSGAQLEAPIEDLGWVADLAESYEWVHDLGPRTSLGIRSRRELRREAAGVVAAVTPWNFPHQLNLAKLGPALAAGCTVVLKAAPDTPLCALALAQLIAERTDIPPGVVNIVTSSDHGIGAQLVADPRVDLVSFTGSTATGKAVMAAAAQTVKRCFLELGGKSAFVILDDADLAAACSYAGFSGIVHAGQGCAITSRVLLPRAQFDDGVSALAETMASIGCGDPSEPTTVCGPLISDRQRSRVEAYLAMAASDGASFACGGGRPDADRGFYISPTLAVGLDNTSRIAREEVFGPVLVALPYDGDAQAVAIANDSPYGLSGAVFGTDPERANAVARGIRSGTVGVNGGLWYSADVPFGGYKQSGIGREMGVLGFEEYLQTKTIANPA